jgi:hypothetical protein
VIYSVIEPDILSKNWTTQKLDEYKQQGYKLNKQPFLPTKTIRVDLSLGEHKLLMMMSKDARQRINKNKEIGFKNYDNLHLIKEFWREWKRWKKGYLPSMDSLMDLKECFGSKGYIMGVEDQSHNILGGCVILESDDTAYYYFGWTSDEGKRRNVQYALVWNAILKAKYGKIKWFDFEGVYDERFPVKSWQGFSAFKHKFRGVDVQMAGSFGRWF